MQSNIFNLKVIFALLVIIIFGYGAWEAVSYAYLAKIFPLSISLVFFVLACTNLWLEIRENDKKSQIKLDSGKSKEEPDTSMSMKEVCIYIGLLYTSIWFISYPLSIAIFISVFYRYIVKTDWILATIAGLVGFDFIILVSGILALDWPTGVITLPWPLG